LLQLAPLLGANVPGTQREAVLAAINGVLGDFLHDTNNPLAIRMSLRNRGQALVSTPHNRIVVVVHGSCMNDLQWQCGEHNHGEAAAASLDAAPMFVHYNTGLHVADNGKALSALLEECVSTWPVPVADITILAHSMGGLVSRSACLHAEQSGHTWRSRLRSIVFLGTPHHGAPLERGGNWIDMLLGISRYSAPFSRLGKIRSAGVTDLRYGTLRAQDAPADRFAFRHDDREPLPLPLGVRCYAVAASTADADADAVRKPGDGLVPIASALGRHSDSAHVLHFDDTLLIHDAHHLDLLSRQDVAAQLCAWLTSK
jgi:hypothetical protein